MNCFCNARLLWCTFLLVGLLSHSACKSDTSVQQDEIERLNRKLADYFEGQQLSDLTGLFADTASIYGSGGYAVSGKEVIQAFWQRYFLPINMEVRTWKTTEDLQVLINDPKWPASLMQLPEKFSTQPKPQQQVLYQWADWNLRYEGEDGVVRSEQFPVLIYWENIPQEGWRILRLYLG